MKRFLSHAAGAVMAALLTVAGCEKGDSQEKPSAPAAERHQGTIVAMGDSLTAGLGLDEADSYPAQLERKLRQAGYRWQVVNAGISGETSSGALSRINWVLRLNPDIVILETGANDGMRGVDPETVRKNLDRIVTILEGKQVVVVLAGMQMLTNLGKEYTDAFAAVYPDIARKHRVILVPFFLANVAGIERFNLRDGIHPTAEGYRLVTENVYPYVVQAIERKKRE